MPQHTLEREVASTNPQFAIAEKIRPVCAGRVELRAGMSPLLETKLRRVQEIVASKERKACSIEGALEAMVDAYLAQHDPIEKAKRKLEKPSAASGQFSRTVKLSPALRSQILLRDQGQCRHLDPLGKRCGNRLWVQVHHVIPRSEGGSDAKNNLITLCEFHHQLKHAPWSGVALSQKQMARRPIEG